MNLREDRELFISPEDPTWCVRNHVHFAYIIIISFFQTKELRHREVNLFEVTVYKMERAGIQTQVVQILHV